VTHPWSAAWLARPTAVGTPGGEPLLKVARNLI
jgi:hypothetical protein